MGGVSGPLVHVNKYGVGKQNLTPYSVFNRTLGVAVYHGLTIPIKWPRIKKEGTVLSPANGFLIFSTARFSIEGQEAVFLCCRSGREVGIEFEELLAYSADEDLTRDYLEQIRWPDGVACPRCGSLDIRGGSDKEQVLTAQSVSTNSRSCLALRYMVHAFP